MLYGLKAASINARRTNFETIQDQVTEYPNGRRPEPTIPGLEEYRNLADVPVSAEVAARAVALDATPSELHPAVNEKRPPAVAGEIKNDKPAAKEVVIPSPNGEGPASRAGQGFTPDKRDGAEVTTRSASPTKIEVVRKPVTSQVIPTEESPRRPRVEGSALTSN